MHFKINLKSSLEPNFMEEYLMENFMNLILQNFKKLQLEDQIHAL